MNYLAPSFCADKMDFCEIAHAPETRGKTP